MEKQGLLRGLKVIKEKGIKVKSLTTDRHPSIKKHMSTEEPRIKHYFDVWHVSKGIKKKLAAASKAKGCNTLDLWIQSTTNHLYWCAAVGEGDCTLIEDMWASNANHVANIHEGHGGIYPQCLHDELDDHAWLVPESTAHKKFKSITQAKHLLKDLRQLAPGLQTYALESIHNVLIGFAPKSTAFSPVGMRARTYLAIFHFNENANKPQAQTKNGCPMFKVKSPRAKKGTFTVYLLKEKPTYHYVSDLLVEATELCRRWPSLKEAFQHTICSAPRAMCDSYERVPKETLIAQQQSRFSDRSSCNPVTT
ncbi:uncharacterized protein LOC135384356 [Ornithodoros turicata]|uniref:uncharacterized protein LOC135384356 n=1 Tax=Ornithodoros turicata TaxID=34597 RepID=UPI0031390937